MPRRNKKVSKQANFRLAMDSHRKLRAIAKYAEATMTETVDALIRLGSSDYYEDVKIMIAFNRRKN